MIRKADFKPARKRTSLTTGDVVKMLRELKGWTQAELAGKTKLHAANISMIENGKVEVGKQRALALAKAFGVHPALIMFPEYETVFLKKRLKENVTV
jgi:transcriptional regulator with XRE-family HTH domain